jgi:peptidoglycan hydrolase-like protein with peptidoglycan-binding domain
MPDATGLYRPPSSRQGAWGVVIGLIALLVLAAVILLATLWSGATLSGDPTALARVDLQPFAGHLVSARATTADGRPIPLATSHGRLTPLAPVAAGQRLSVTVVVKRPGWLGWALGSTRTEHLTVYAPVAHVASRWLTVASGSPVRISFASPITAIAYGSERQTFATPQRSVALLNQAPAGSIEVAAAVRPWERLGAPIPVSWFPATRTAAVVSSPAPDTELASTDAIRLTFSRPVKALFGSSLPRLDPAVSGSWQRTDSHTLVFTPAGLGVPIASHLQVVLPRALALANAASGVETAQVISWRTPQPSILRLQQLLAQTGYLPVGWSGRRVARTASAQLAAAVAPPGGSFHWRYPDTPRTLAAQWHPGHANAITRGAVMTFEQTHGLAVDGIAGPMVWHALLSDVLAGHRRTVPYSYVYVHTRLPQLLTLWSGGHTVLTSPGNTGIPSRPTVPGTFQVFEHIPVGTMTGTNPDGSHYHDPGIRWISYFNGGDAIHAFPRASYGTPQSLGCVELPAAAAAKVWPYTPIGTLVTIEN